MGLRRQAREAALQMLFECDVKGELGASVRTVPRTEQLAPAALAFAEQLVRGVSEHLQDIDRLIEKYAEHWSVDRMSVVDRNVLRCAISELLYAEDVPVKVTVNEAIEVAKQYGNEYSGAFVNGILDALMHNEAQIVNKKVVPHPPLVHQQQ